MAPKHNVAAKSKLTQPKLSFHSASFRSSRPLSSTPSFSLPSSSQALIQSQPAIDKGKQRQNQPPSPSLSSQQELSSLWADRFSPTSTEHLAVHTKKVQDVRSWLQLALAAGTKSKHYPKILVLSGPTGSAKSATIRALASASEMDFEMLEWQNQGPCQTDDYSFGSSFADRFSDFLTKASKFPTLHFSNAPSDTPPSPPQIQQGPSSTRRIILIEDLPNIHHPDTRSTFHAILERYIADPYHDSVSCTVPIVLIISECAPKEDDDRWIGNSSFQGWKHRLDSVIDVRVVLSDAIRKHPSYTEIRFNPIAPTIMLKGLKRAVDLQFPKTSGVTTPIELIRAIAEDSAGDIRAAINCLQFVCSISLRDKAAKVAGRKRGIDGNSKIAPWPQSDLHKLPLISGRESSLALFHAVGKVLYNKREGDPGKQEEVLERRKHELRSLIESDPDQGVEFDSIHSSRSELRSRLNKAIESIINVQDGIDQASIPHMPLHLKHLERRKSRVDTDALWSDMPVDPTLFQLYIHQNYPLFTTEIEQCAEIVDAISTADFIRPQQEYRYSSLSSHYNFLVTVYGTLLHLPSPMPRQGQKLNKAAFWDVMKKTRENQASLESVKAFLALPRGRRVDGPSEHLPLSSQLSGLKRVVFQHTRRQQPTEANTFSDLDRADAGLGQDERSTLMIADCTSLVTEILPLLAKIGLTKQGTAIDHLSRMRFEYAGVSDLAVRPLNEHDIDLSMDPRDVEITLPQPDGKNPNGKLAMGLSPGQSGIADDSEKLFLSDDDIEED